MKKQHREIFNDLVRRAKEKMTPEQIRKQKQDYEQRHRADRERLERIGKKIERMNARFLRIEERWNRV